MVVRRFREPGSGSLIATAAASSGAAAEDSERKRGEAACRDRNDGNPTQNQCPLALARGAIE
jgi:hypothetical protein